MRAVHLASEPSTASPYITAAECAAYLRFASVRALYKAIPVDGIPFRRCGRKLLFVPAELDRWLAGESKVTLLSEARRRHVPTVAAPAVERPSNSIGDAR